MVAYLVRGSRAHDGVVEGQPVTAQDLASLLRGADHDLGAVLGPRGVGDGEPDPLVLAQSKRHNLAEPSLGPLLERDV